MELQVEVHRYIGLAKYRLPIWQDFQYRQSAFFEIVPILLPIFYTSTNWLILLMHCLVVTSFYCVDNHFTSFVAILLLLIMVYNEFYYIICAIDGKKQLVMYIGSAIGIGSFQAIYRLSKMENFVSVHLYLQVYNYMCKVCCSTPQCQGALTIEYGI